MAKFMLLYRSPISAEEMMANAKPEDMQAGMQPWMDWFGKWGAAVVDGGNPMGKAVSIGADGSTTTGSTQVNGYSIIEAEGMTEAKKMTDGHPHLMMPGHSIEILEIMPMPGM